jgi:hypothetical protein
LIAGRDRANSERLDYYEWSFNLNGIDMLKNMFCWFGFSGVPLESCKAVSHLERLSELKRKCQEMSRENQSKLGRQPLSLLLIFPNYNLKKKKKKTRSLENSTWMWSLPLQRSQKM